MESGVCTHRDKAHIKWYLNNIHRFMLYYHTLPYTLVTYCYYRFIPMFILL